VGVLVAAAGQLGIFTPGMAKALAGAEKLEVR
jgi:hypothetical protein